MKYPDGKPNKEQPLKVNDHGCDTTRYIVHYLDKPGGMEVAENPFYQ
jgi:hypothetical protein